MEIRLHSLLDGAKQAQGTVIVIDVFRAFTTAAVAFSRGAAKIYLVAEVEEALALRDRGVVELCMGEVGGKRPPGFDYGNSPFEISTAPVKGKVLVQSTRAGTVGISAVPDPDALYACSLVIAGATVKAIAKQSPELVSIVAMGTEGKVRNDEDEQCALYLRNLLQGRKPDRNAVRLLAGSGQDAMKFGDPSLPQYHPRDKEIALQIDSLPFAIKVERENGLLAAHPVR